MRSQRSQRGLELVATGGRIEVVGEAGHPAAVELELPVGIASCRQDEEGPPSRGGELLLRKRDAVARDEREHRARLPVTPLPEARLQLLEDPAVGLHQCEGYDRR